MLVGLSEQAEQELLVGGADHMKAPESPQLAAHIRVLPQHPSQDRSRIIEWSAVRRPLVELVSRLADKPLVLMQLQAGKLLRRQLRKIDGSGGPGLAVRDPEDPARGPVDAIVLVALADISPVENEDLAGGPRQQLDPAEPGIPRLDHVLAMHRAIGRPVALEMVAVEAAAVKIHREYIVAVLRRPVAAEVDHHSRVGVTSTGLVGRVAQPLLGGMPGFT